MSLSMLYTVISLNSMGSKLPSHLGKPSFCPIKLFGFCYNNSHFLLNKSLMICQKLSIATSWQIIGMNNAGLSCRETGHQMGTNHIVISQLVQKYQHVNDIKNRPGKPHKTSPQDRALLRLVRRCPFSSNIILSDNWSNFNEDHKELAEDCWVPSQKAY